MIAPKDIDTLRAALTKLQRDKAAGASYLETGAQYEALGKLFFKVGPELLALVPRHECGQNTIELIVPIYGFGPNARGDSLGIYLCKCGQWWMIRNQSDPGSGRDDIWLKPNETKRGYTFTGIELNGAVEIAREKGLI